MSEAYSLVWSLLVLLFPSEHAERIAASRNGLPRRHRAPDHRSLQVQYCSKCPLRITTGNALIEQKISDVPLIADVRHGRPVVVAAFENCMKLVIPWARARPAT